MRNLFQPKKDVYRIATECALNHLERGVAPWLSNWSKTGIPRNLITREEFKGINVFLLASLGYPKNLFLTPKQLHDNGGTLKAGEQRHPVFYWTQNSNRSGQTDGIKKNEKPILRYFLVYNIAQSNGIKKSRIPRLHHRLHPLEMCVALVGNMPQCPTIHHGKLPAMYMSMLDCIDIPFKDHYPNDETYYSTLFRCLIHSTGHESRLNRREVMEATVTDGDFQITETLISDIGAAMLSGMASIQYMIRGDLANYCKEWSERLQKDPKLIVYASTQAQSAVDFILNRKQK